MFESLRFSVITLFCLFLEELLVRVEQKEEKKERLK